MKLQNKYYFIICTVFFLFSCSKNDDFAKLSKTELSNLSEEQQRVYHTLNLNDKVSFNYVNNQANINAPFSSVFGSCSKGVDFKISFEHDVYESTNSYLDTDWNIDDYIGKRTSFSVAIGNVEEDYNIYIPKMLQLEVPSTPFETIDRTFNMISWNKDPMNTLGVFLAYTTFDAHYLNKDKNQIEYNYKIIADEGYFDISSIISDPKVKCIQLLIQRGNAVETEYGSNKFATIFLTRESILALDIKDN